MLRRISKDNTIEFDLLAKPTCESIHMLIAFVEDSYEIVQFNVDRENEAIEQFRQYLDCGPLFVRVVRVTGGLDCFSEVCPFHMTNPLNEWPMIPNNNCPHCQTLQG